MSSLLNVHSSVFLSGEKPLITIKKNTLSNSPPPYICVASASNNDSQSLSLSDKTFLTSHGRREICLSGLTGLLLGGLNIESAFAAASVNVGSYLPKADDERFVVFSPGLNSTPALRAGNVSPYTFYIPPTWTQSRIANILSGNYCQPKCAEPWIEVKFEDPKQGTISVVASPMVRLTNKPNATIEEIGSPETIIAALGPFVTGDSYDPEELVETNIRTIDGQTYYDYVLETPYARSGTHNLAAATAKGNTVLLFVVSASDSQWSNSEKLLRRIIKSFSV